MAYDYSKLATTARTLIDRYGRSVTLTKSGSTAQVTGSPWRGVSNSFNDTVPGTSVTTKGAFVEYQEKDFGDEIQRGDKLVLVAADGIADITAFDGLREGTANWRIVNKTIHKPGDTALLYALQVRQ